MQVTENTLALRSKRELLERNTLCERFFTAEAPRLAAACKEMAQRFLDGGRLLAFGHGAGTTDAQHVAVEFVHPVIVGKRALPAIDLGPEFESRLPVVLRREDMVMGFALDAPDPAVTAALRHARERGALTFGLSDRSADFDFPLPGEDPAMGQEVAEILYHLLWETVHVFFEHREQGHDVGASAFLYPFLGREAQGLDMVVEQVQDSMLQKSREVCALRSVAAETEVDALAAVAHAMHERLRRGGKVLTFGNGGSATDANDLAIDCVAPVGMRPIPAISLSAEPAIITAVSNDVGNDAIFTRQIIAHGRPEDVAIGISTSGSSPNVLAALAHARKLGCLTVGIAGYGGGRMATGGLVDHVLAVQSDYVPRIQEVQASLYHVLRRRLHDLSNEEG